VADEFLIYVVGDEELTKLVPAKLGSTPTTVIQCKAEDALVREMTKGVPDLIVMDAKFATGKGDSLDHVRGRYQDLPVIVVGQKPSTRAVVECMKKGAEDFVTRDVEDRKLPEKFLRAAENHRLTVRVKQLTNAYKRGGMGEMVGVSSAMHDIYARIRNIANTDATVLITGESGTGKELVAHAIHTLSPRADGAFVTVNCAAIPKDLLESELFGHEKGSFTGADRQHMGSCERSHGGTLFLDEICEMDLGLQSKVLRFLQNHVFTRVGGTENIEVDSRVIAASNKDPLEEVERGNLRDDLYYRLNVVPIHLPPLRERPEDIPVLAQQFLGTVSEKYNKFFWDFSPEAVRLLLCYSWPGNVRELRNTIERIVVLANTDRVTPDLFPERVRKAAVGAELPELAVEEALECIKKALQAPPEPAESEEVIPFLEVEKRAILGAIQKCNGDISKAARKLGLSRATLYRKLEKYGVR
jgi:DNA-binding NtrC family response regulator